MNPDDIIRILTKKWKRARASKLARFFGVDKGVVLAAIMERPDTFVKDAQGCWRVKE